MNSYDPDSVYVARKRCGCIVAFISGVVSAETVAEEVSDSDLIFLHVCGRHPVNQKPCAYPIRQVPTRGRGGEVVTPFDRAIADMQRHAADQGRKGFIVDLPALGQTQWVWNKAIDAVVAYLVENRQRFRSGPTGDAVIADIQRMNVKEKA